MKIRMGRREPPPAPCECGHATKCECWEVTWEVKQAMRRWLSNEAHCKRPDLMNYIQVKAEVARLYPGGFDAFVGAHQ